MSDYGDPLGSERSGGMMDIIYIVITVVFFVIAAGYVYFCDKI